MNSITELINGLYAYIPPLTKKGEEENSAQKFYGIVEKAIPSLISAILSKRERRFIFITSSSKKALYFYKEVKSYLKEISHNNSQLLLFQPWELLPYEISSPHPEIMGERLNVLNNLLTNPGSSVITSIDALLRFIVPPHIVESSTIELNIGDEKNPTHLINQLFDLGYNSESLVERPGQMSRRGNILDIYPPGNDYPVRIDYFGDVIEELKTFNPITQRSLVKLEGVSLLPTREAVIKTIDTENALKRASLISKKHRKTLEIIINNAPDCDGLESFIPVIYEEKSTLFDYIKDLNGVVFVNPEDIIDKATEITEQLWDCYETAIKHKHPVPPPTETSLYIEDIYNMCQKTSTIEIYSAGSPLSEDGDEICINTIEFGNWRNNLSLFKRDLNKIPQKTNVIITVDNDTKRNKLKAFLKDLNGNISSKVSIQTSDVEGGFYMPDLNIAIASEREIFYKSPSKKLLKTKTIPDDATPISTFADLSPGDYCAHIKHGIGVYQGLIVLDVEGINREFALINYRDNAKLYVPVDEVDAIFRYSIPEKSSITPDILGGKRWKKSLKKARTKAKEIAKELIGLYRDRKNSRGYKYSEDTVWQFELEDSFPYEETKDQIKAIKNTKFDMEKTSPMDRLICGDVGFGKTEVAVRASFKAVSDGKQVAVLTPTTILASQHLSTFRERLGDFPITIEMLSRLNKPSKNKEVIKGLALGTVDIVIGTHRLLSKDVFFNDLGLLIIDEEQRFGVKHKERIKHKRVNVDCLTLTATPIPRTLQMSLSGIRDISMINTPPHNRLPIYTYIRRYDRNLVRDAIMREIHRGGQVYFIHNRVENIELVAQSLRDILPDVSFRVAHGQMNEDDLAEVMNSFYMGEFDCLVATSIIESGIDNPDVNTMLINNAHMFGLAQLHQLRGRVGRSGVQAFCYLLIPQNKKLTREAKSRLEAIRDTTHLGGGVSIALKDLEIRGAGAIFGSEQSGHIEAIGFETYNRILEEEVEKASGGEPVRTRPIIDIKIEAYLPEGYIPESQARLGIYRQILNADSFEEIEDIYSLIVDMYGKPPEETKHLIDIAMLRIAGTEAKISSIKKTGEYVNIVFNKPPEPEVLAKSGEINGFVDVKLKPSGDEGYILLLKPDFNKKNWIEDLIKVIKTLKS